MSKYIRSSKGASLSEMTILCLVIAITTIGAADTFGWSMRTKFVGVVHDAGWCQYQVTPGSDGGPGRDSGPNGGGSMSSMDNVGCN